MVLTVLLLEDDQRWLQRYREGLQGLPISILEVTKVSEAQDIMSSRTVDIVVVDGQLEDSEIVKTCAFVARLREDGFAGQMIAASSDLRWCKKLMQAGCDHSIAEGKWDLPQKVTQILGQLG